MNTKRWWIGTLGGGVLCAAGTGFMIYSQYGKIEESKADVANVRTNIDSSRKLIEGTAALERDVIVLRELSQVMKRILPDTEDVNNLVRTFQKFSEESGVRISGLKKKTNDARDKGEFDKVAYTLSLDADAFQFLDFLDLTESHARFMRVPNFHITAAARNAMGDKNSSAPVAHKMQVDVETFVYEPKKDAAPVKIDGYDRKRDLLLGEINRRRAGLSVATYKYNGARGRRDPWIDPRVPLLGDGESTLTVQGQMDLVQEMIDRTQAVMGLWETFKKADSVIAELTTRSDLETALAKLEEDVRRLEGEKSIRYVPSERKFHAEVVDVVARLRKDLEKTEADMGPSVNMLREIETAMVNHETRGEYKLMLEAFSAIEPQLALADKDALRKPMADRLRQLSAEATTVLDFEKLDLKVDGLSIIAEGQPVVLINGKPLGIGDMLDNGVVVRAISAEEIEFIFRGVIFARHL